MIAMGFDFAPIERFRLPDVGRAIEALQDIFEKNIQRGRQSLGPYLLKLSDRALELHP
jgi:hypothetical protein